MSRNRGPNTSEKCPFYVLPNNPLSAETSVNQCVQCATCGNARLKGMRDDFRQLAYLTIMEEEPKYDPDHPSGASFVTFIKSRVCYRLWSERRKEAKYTPFSHDETFETDASPNLLVESLIAGACASESIEDEVGRKIEVEQLRSLYPQMLDALLKKERQVINLKFFKDCSGREISRKLGISEGRVSQLTKSALSKLRKAHSKLLSV
ncbi:hypothetical protein C6503_05770 [Candidatus Poribacteria bacterium]|nr:MAG: hypothetical protein C6503_05770 [Candidatus Poribacteria bacterium]